MNKEYIAKFKDGTSSSIVEINGDKSTILIKSLPRKESFEVANLLNASWKEAAKNGKEFSEKTIANLSSELESLKKKIRFILLKRRHKKNIEIDVTEEERKSITEEVFEIFLSVKGNKKEFTKLVKKRTWPESADTIIEWFFNSIRV